MSEHQPSRIATGAIALLGVLNLGRGSIHLFASHGGLTEIAGIDLSQGKDIILFFIGAVGVGQITLGLLDLSVAIRHRAMVLPLLLIHWVGMALAVFLFFIQRPLPVTPPGQYGAVASIVIFGIIAIRELLLRNGRENG